MTIPGALMRLPIHALRFRRRRFGLAVHGGRRYAIRFQLDGTVRVRALAILH